MSEQAFIQKISACAVKDMEASGILASVTIAQGILESGYGTTELAINASNYFGMKCELSGNTWESVWDKNSKYTKRTKEQDKAGNEYEVEADFRMYPDMETSVKDHSCYLNGAMKGTKLRYAGLKGEKDYRKAVQIIKDGGYATDTKYVDKVCSIIERFNLAQYDIIEEDNAMAKRVCIDAGHYGKYNRCPNNSAYYESDMVWKLHLLQKRYLEALGIEVITTRANKDKDLALNTRGIMAKGCDLFISDHSNAVGSGMNEAIDYAAIYHLVDDITVKCDDISKEIACKIAPVIANVMGTKQGYRVVTRKSGNDRNGDGMMNDNYYGVLHAARSVNVPGLILEHSFHTNSATVAWLLNDANLDRLARAEAECIASYLLGKEVRLDDAKEDEKKDTEEVENTIPNAPFSVRVIIPDLNYRSEPSMNGAVLGQTGVGSFTIVEVKNGWGKLKSGAGWIYLENPEYCTIHNSVSESIPEKNELPYKVRVSIADLNIRTGAGTEYTVVQKCPVGVYSIVEERDGKGASKWGKLKSGAGWISLDYVEKL